MGTPLYTGEHCRILLPARAVTPGHLIIEVPGAAPRIGGLAEDQAMDVIHAYGLVRVGLRNTSGCDAYAISLSYGWTSRGAGIGEPEPDGPHPQLHIFGRSADETVKPVGAMAVPMAERPHLPHPDPDALRRALATAQPDVPTVETDPVECGCCVASVQRDQELWRRNGARVITPLDPIVSANLLAMPLRHVASVAALRGEELVSLWDRLGEVIMHLDTEGLSTFVNDGRRAAQHIPHVHVHVFARSATEPANPFEILLARLGLRPQAQSFVGNGQSGPGSTTAQAEDHVP
jgi:diadenosine tetraphosphate (Ap4A) HIT family hydrolase